VYSPQRSISEDLISKALCFHCKLKITPRITLNKNREENIIIGIHIVKVSHIGAFKIIEKPNAIGTIKILTKNMTKTAGPSPASSFGNFSPHAKQLFSNVKNFLNILPSPHLGQAPFKPVVNGDKPPRLMSNSVHRKNNIYKSKKK